jgi:pre-mRNA-processing factor SLU7
MDLILGQSDRYVEYNEQGQAVNAKKKDATKSKYIEDQLIGDHTSVWGSWWNEILGTRRFWIRRMGL